MGKGAGMANGQASFGTHMVGGGASAAAAAAAAAGLETRSLRSFAVALLPFRTPDYVGRFCDKLDGEGIVDPHELTKISVEALEQRLSTQGLFNLQEIADAVSLQNFMWKESRKGGGDRDRSGHGGSPPRRASPSHGWGKGSPQWRRNGEGSRSRSAEGRPWRHEGLWHSRMGRGGAGGGGGQSRAGWRGPRNSWRGGGRGESLEKPALWQAVEACDQAAVASLLQDGHDCNATFRGWTPLMKAAEDDQEDILRLLLQSNASLHSVNSKGRSALSFAAAPSMKRPSALKCLKLLLESQADQTQEDVMGCSPKDRAQREKRNDSLAILEDWEANHR